MVNFFWKNPINIVRGKKETKEVPNLCIFIEHAIHRLQKFPFIKHKVLISLLGNIDDVVIVQLFAIFTNHCAKHEAVLIQQHKGS